MLTNSMPAPEYYGRPRQYKSRYIFSLALETNLVDALRETARREGKPMNKIIEGLVVEYLKSHGGGNLTFHLEKWVGEDQGVEAFKAMPTLGEDPKRYGLENWNREELRELEERIYTWSSEVTQHLEGKRSTKIRHGDIEWLMSSRGWTEEQAKKHLIEAGFEE